MRWHEGAIPRQNKGWNQKPNGLLRRAGLSAATAPMAGELRGKP